MSVFLDTVPGAAPYSACLCWCTIPEPHALWAAAVPFSEAGAQGSDHRPPAECTQLHTQNGRERASAKKDSGLGPNH